MNVDKNFDIYQAIPRFAFDTMRKFCGKYDNAAI